MRRRDPLRDAKQAFVMQTIPDDLDARFLASTGRTPGYPVRPHQRINYVRHELSNYDVVCRRYFRRGPEGDQYRVWVNHKIAEALKVKEAA